jgi:hypothetical protein
VKEDANRPKRHLKGRMMGTKFKLKKNENPFEYEPSCEQEIVAAFGLLATRLGYRILDLGGSFPDCKAKKVDTGEEVLIELELRSGEFHTHGHDPKKCDLVVCWEENVKLGKPDVITLKDYFPDLPSKPYLDDWKGARVNVHRIVVARASEPEGISYPELKELFKLFHPREVKEPLRCLARLYKWGAFLYPSKGRLKLRNRPEKVKFGEYSLKGCPYLLDLAKELMNQLEEEWRAESAILQEEV